MRVRVVLVGIEGPVNLGIIARTCVNFDVDELYIVNPKADINEALKYAAKARDFLAKAQIVSSLDEAIKGVDLVAATSAIGYGIGDVLRQAVSIEDFVKEIRGRVNSIAIMFGRESTGLTREEIAKADVLVTIPANPGYPVLNISQAVSIILWELWKIRGVKPENIPPRATRTNVEELLEVVKDITMRVVKPEDKVKRILVVWKYTLFRARPSVYEYKILRYWFRKVKNKLERLHS
ncbi:MAG: TrmJ/YjtD family RNA methyltransferase [Thermoprotei archaeon]